MDIMNNPIRIFGPGFPPDFEIETYCE